MHSEPSHNDEIYQSLFNNMRSAVAYCRMLFENGKPMDFVYLMANPAFAVQTGFHDVVGKKVTEVIPRLKPGDPEVFDRYAQVALTGNPDCFEIYSESLEKWFLVSLHSPKPEHFIAVLDNITQRKAAQVALEEKEQVLRQFIERAPAAIAMFDTEMRYLAVSRRFIDDYRLSDASLIGRSHYEVFPEIPEHWREFHRRSLAGETIRCEEDAFVRKDGRTDWQRWEITPWFSGRKVGGILMFTESITDRKEAEEQKARLSAQLQLALDAANLGWWHYDPAKEVIYSNHRNQEQVGFTSEVNPEEEMLRRIHPDDRSGVLAQLQAALNPDYPRTFHVQYRVILPDGSVRWLEDYAKATFIGEGTARHAISLVGTAADITDRKRVEERLKESEEKFRTLIEQAADAYFVHDCEGRFIEVNKAACDILGYTREELLQINANRVKESFDLADLKQIWNQAYASKEVINDITSFHRKDGTSVPVEVRVNALAIGGEKLFIAMARDITERIQAEEALRLAAKVYQDSSEAMMVLDENRNIIMVNRAFADITGYYPDEVIGQHPRFLRVGHPGDALYKADDVFYQDMWRQADKAGRFKGEIWHKKRDGQFIAIQITVNVIAGESGLPNRYVVLLSDITERRRSDDVIWSQANFDTLTGLPNRRFFRDRLEHEVRNAKRSRLPLALLFIDLDGFKDVNDTLGHDMGDLLLKEAADRLRRCMRESDTVARLGGDEFTVILAELHDPGNTHRVARHILKVLSEPVKLGEELAYVSASIGITLYPNDATEADDLIRNADQAMYEAKERGKNQYQYFTPSMQQAAIERMHLINDMRKALERDQFEILYQPIVELSTGLIRKGEALIRWRHPKRGLVNPVEFISAAEDTGMITSFGDWIFREAAKQAVLWRENLYPDFQISVNISPVQFKKEGIDPAIWLEHLKAIDLPGQGIVVEITEGLLMEASLKVTDQLLMLRDAGIEVALDDFGTGYSSLVYLKRFDIDYLKIDQAFVQNLSANSDDMALCEAIIVMAHKLGLKVIAEGIETDFQRALLTSAGCDFAQGYLFSKPVSADEFERLVEADPY